MVCLSTSSLSGDLFLAGPASTAKGLDLRSVHGFIEKDDRSYDWIQPVACLLAVVENLTKKKVTAYAFSSVYVGRGL